MNKEQVKRLINESNIGIKTLSNSHALIIQPNNTGEMVRYQFDYGDDASEIEEAEIEFIEYSEEEDSNDEWVPAFKIQADNGEHEYYYLHDFMRV